LRVNGPQNDKEAIQEMLPEVVVSAVVMPNSQVVLLKHRNPDCK
jgi:hypothetical protein